ncbi:GRIP and coiled-coil domain-containing protein 1 isoform X2 [Toxorhynchites rutilus septentrionalis]|uniref:GRIP and coiled-coil domain-containing protein 1 isoform X2 n=1 Tax=Toxorhynchites rutilus septentrionalis TaxID=329112 RepID=UPI002478BC81|nr:GRIP and coiled-coil domain-containing protein 1 isoform X2 [Toxorhynchites rutilus septentrionalis]
MQKQDLEAVVNSQKEQLLRYEKRLKDVVTAYKGLLKEKTALETSLAAFTSNGSSTDSGNVEQTNASAGTKESNGENLREQVATLMNSLATLTAEKGRIEVSFKNDRKQLREVIAEKEATIRDLEEQIKALNYTIKTDLENCKTKMKHDREEECNGQLVMICELQKQLLDERHLNETLEMQLRDLKIQFNQRHSEKRVNEMPQASELTKQSSEQLESSKKENAALSSLLHQFQGEIDNLKRQHASAIKNEQRRVFVAEERSKKLEEVHEERVANLEARLAELSDVVGTYDRLRQLDQDNISKLKEKLSKLNLDNNTARRVSQESNVERIVEEISYLKNLLLAENSKLENPFDLSCLFSISATVEDAGHQLTDLEDYRSLQHSHAQVLSENETLKASIEVHSTNTKTLQEKIKVLNKNIDDLEVEYKNKQIEYNNVIKTEKARTQELICVLESDFKSKLSQLEMQLKKQRERSLQLLEEKEEEIKSLRTSFDILMHDGNGQKQPVSSENNNSDYADNFPAALSKKMNALNSVFKTEPNGNSETHHILHYAHELARREIEITSLRTAKNNTEAALRQALHDKIASQEELHEHIANLEEQIDRGQPGIPEECCA